MDDAGYNYFKTFMKPSAPNKVLWAVALIAGILGIVGHLTSVNYLTEYSFMLVLVGFVLLAIGTSFKGT
jgi:Flp pilus assembly pilin Flp